MKNKGRLFVISGPSGVGKGTVCKLILSRNDDIKLSVSATTRTPRTEDTEGVTYYFKSKAEFEKMIEDSAFLEWAVYNGNYYGTPLSAVENNLESGISVILEIDAQGALDVKKKRPDAVLIFIAPPDKDTLFERLKGRGTEGDEEIAKRIAAADWELSQMEKYDYTVVNDDLDTAVINIENIMKSEKEKM